MRCTACGHLNVPDARFCSQCGTRLGVVCAACATVNEPSSRFCSHCGTALDTAAPAESGDKDLSRYVPEELLRRIRAARRGGTMRGERRTVTMLFADIQGSTAAAERLDPEDWADIINGAFQHLIAPIYRYEGTLARLQGDAILAFFGAPIAHEDDPVRAVRAGLDIVSAIAGYRSEVEVRTGVPIDVRVGINTGLVVVGEVGSDLRVEYTALGDAINVAARMEQTAEPGSVRVTEHTANLVAGAFDLLDIGGVDVKGKTEPVAAFRVIGASSDRPVRAATTPMVGRAAEHEALVSVAERVSDGIGVICSLVGEAGIGKSRLLSSVRTAVETRFLVATDAADDGSELAWIEGRSRSFDTTVPHATFADLLRRWWGLESASGTPWTHVVAAVTRALGAPDTDLASFLATLAGVQVPDEHAELVSTLPTPALHQRTTEAVAAYVEAEASHRPVMLVLDDLHWADALSLALVERLMGSTETTALAIVVAMRPYRDDPSWRLVETAGRDFAHRYTSVDLRELDSDAASALVATLAQDTDLPAAVRERIVAHANGNPLFVEELVRALQDTPPDDGAFADHIDVPASLNGLLTSRLDQLDDGGRHVAQVASVIGHDFSQPILQVLLDADTDLHRSLAELVRRGIIVERRRRPEPLYAFRHALIQETAYSTTLLRTRRQLHARLAAHLEQSQPDAVQDIARHWLEANDRDRAFPFLVRAGEHATRAMALSVAIELFTTALDGVPADAERDLVVRAHDGLGEAYGLIPSLSDAASVYQRLLDYGRSFDAPSVQVLALNRLGIATATHAGDFVRAEQYLADARVIAEACGDEIGLAEYHMNACFIASLQGDLDRAIEHDAETARLGSEQGQQDVRLAGLMRRAMNLLTTTQYDEGEPALRQAIELAVSLGARESEAAMRAIGEGELAMRAGDLERARRLFQDEIPVLERFSSFYASIAHGWAAEAALAAGDVEGAIAHAGAARRLGEFAHQPFVVSIAAAVMAHAYALCGLDELHTEFRTVALDALLPPMGDFTASSTWVQLGRASLVRGAIDEAGRDFRTGLTVSSSTRFWQRPGMLIGLAAVALARSEPTEARRLLDEATTFVAERDIVLHDAELALGAGLVARVERRFHDAVADLERAQHIAAAMGRRLVERDAAAAQFELSQAMGDHDAAQRHHDGAQRITADIAASIAEERLREAFLERSATLLKPPVVGGP